MSAFVVSKAHIDTLLTVAIQVSHCPGSSGVYSRALGYIDRTNATLFGQMLHDENVKSVNYRYERSVPEDVYVYERRPCDVLHDILDTRVRNIAQALKAVQCYEYQSCEHPGWEASEAKWFCDSLRSALIQTIPGYGDAEWEITQ